jgi:flagellar hook-basal body complex protein FliE
MSNSINGFSSIQTALNGAGAAQPGKPEQSFVETLQTAMGSVEQAQTDAQQSVSSMLSGNGEEVHRTMVAVEKADLSFQLMMEVRNKIIAAYQEVSKMSF